MDEVELFAKNTEDFLIRLEHLPEPDTISDVEVLLQYMESFKLFMGGYAMMAAMAKHEIGEIEGKESGESEGSEADPDDESLPDLHIALDTARAIVDRIGFHRNRFAARLLAVAPVQGVS
jgi:hypothetical protein